MICNICTVLPVPQESFEEDEELAADWGVKSLRVRSKIDLLPTARPWTSRTPSPKLLGLPSSARMMDVVDVAWGGRPSGQSIEAPWYVDASQDISRFHFQHGDSIPCLTTSSLIYSFRSDAVIPPRGKLLLLGFPAEEAFETLDDRSLNDMTGEAMFLGDVGAVVMGIYLNRFAPWWQS